MLRVCTEADRKILETYLNKEPYGKAILAAVEQFGFEETFQTVYLDSELLRSDEEDMEPEEKVKGVYLWYFDNLLLYCEDNQVATDFIEQQIFMSAPKQVVGRVDNVNIVSWLLTDYGRVELTELPEIADENGIIPDCFQAGEKYCGQWLQLKGESLS